MFVLYHYQSDTASAHSLCEEPVRWAELLDTLAAAADSMRAYVQAAGDLSSRSGCDSGDSCEQSSTEKRC